MKFGSHVSAAGGVDRAPANATAVGCETFQRFTRSPRGGAAPKLTKKIVTAFKSENKKYGFTTCYVHTPYFINFASANSRVRQGSIAVVRDELERSSLLGATALMTHLGSSKDFTVQKAQALVVEGLLKLLNGYTGTTKFLIEIAAGQGLILGATFEEVALYITAVEEKNKKLKNKIGVCFDTCHAFASGYDLKTPQAVKKTLAQFDQTIGLDRLGLIHANDSKFDLGAKRDRHEHIGQGKIGVAGFRALVAQPKLKNVDFILETPKEDDADQKNLALLKSFRKK